MKRLPWLMTAALIIALALPGCANFKEFRRVIAAFEPSGPAAMSDHSPRLRTGATN